MAWYGLLASNESTIHRFEGPCSVILLPLLKLVPHLLVSLSRLCAVNEILDQSIPIYFPALKQTLPGLECILYLDATLNPAARTVTRQFLPDFDDPRSSADTEDC